MSTITRHIEEYRWFCVDKDRATELDKFIADATYQLEHLSANVAGGYITGFQCLQQERVLKLMIKDWREERGKLWRRVKRTVDETEETFEPIVEPDPSVQGKPLVRIRELGVTGGSHV